MANSSTHTHLFNWHTSQALSNDSAPFPSVAQQSSEMSKRVSTCCHYHVRLFGQRLIWIHLGVSFSPRASVHRQEDDSHRFTVSKSMTKIGYRREPTTPWPITRTKTIESFALPFHCFCFNIVSVQPLHLQSTFLSWLVAVITKVKSLSRSAHTSYRRSGWKNAFAFWVNQHCFKSAM